MCSVTSQTDETSCDDTVRDWLHTLQHDQLEMAANTPFCHLALTILDPDRSGISGSEHNPDEFQPRTRRPNATNAPSLSMSKTATSNIAYDTGRNGYMRTARIRCLIDNHRFPFES